MPHLDRMLEAAQEGIWVLDRHGVTTYANAFLGSLLGRDPAEVVGATVFDFLPPDRIEEVRAGLARRRLGESERYEADILRGDGERVCVRISSVPMLDAAGEYDGAFAIVSDVSPVKETERALARREREYESLVNSIPDIVMRFDCDLRQVYANPAAREGLEAPPPPGLRPSEMGESVPHPARWEQVLREVFETGVERRTVFEMPGPGGQRWFESRIVPERGESGGVETVLDVMRDVTGIKRAEEELRQQSRDLTERVKEARCLYAASDLLTHWTDESEAEVMERVVELLPAGWMVPDQARARLTLDGRSWETPGFTPTAWRLEAPIGPAGGARGRVEIAYLQNPEADRGDPFLPEERELLTAVAQRIDDVLKRRAAEERLAHSEAYFRSLIENADEVISILDPDGTIRYESPAIERLLGSRPGDHVGRSGFDFVHPEDRERVARTLEQGLSRGTERFDSRYRLVREDGAVRHVESTAVNLIADPAVGGVVIATRDITERIELERQLQQAQKMEAIGRLAGGVAHDFNNALTVILGHAELLQGFDRTDEAVGESADEIRQAAVRAAHLTRRLLSFSRIEAVEQRPIDVNAVIRDLQRMLDRLIGEDIRLITELDYEAPIVRADAGQIEQVLMNLVINARDAVATGGTIVLRTLRGGCPEGPETCDPGQECLTIEVQDDGVGMSEETLARIFEPYFTTKPNGTGLGLSMVYGIVQQSRGWIEVASAPGEGATFRIHLPESSGPAEAVAQRAPAAVQVDRLQGRILLVEDEESVRQLAQVILERSGLDVVPAALPSEAIARVEAGEPVDLLLTDVVMPQMSGHDLARRLRDLRPGLPVVYMSGYPADDRVLTTVREDARTRYLAKPFTASGLIGAVAQGLERPAGD